MIVDKHAVKENKGDVGSGTNRGVEKKREKGETEANLINPTNSVHTLNSAKKKKRQTYGSKEDGERKRATAIKSSSKEPKGRAKLL